MKKKLLFVSVFALCVIGISASAQVNASEEIVPIRPDYDRPNYDESKIAPYALEDPLTFVNGEKVKTAADWRRRRQEILDIFAHEMYGLQPPRPARLVVDKHDEKNNALAGFAVRTQYKMYFRADRTGPCINWILYRPRHIQTPVPVILFLNFYGNQELEYDRQILLMGSWVRNRENARKHRMTDASRGRMCNPDCATVMPLGMIIAQGYAVMTACYADISPDPNGEDKQFDQEHFAYTGVFELWGRRDDGRTDNITALGAWAWGLSRGGDLVETLPELDARKIAVTGSSRLGKAALLAAARDERFAVCIPNQCGGGGVTLAKRDYGENIGTEMKMFRHWYCRAYRKYAKNPARLLTFDQHLLVAAIAPRHLLVQGFGSPWFDAKGEFLSCQAASAVWKFLGKPGLPHVDFPGEFDTSAVGPYLGYARRSEKHGIAAWDWMLILKFANQAFGS